MSLNPALLSQDSLFVTISEYGGEVTLKDFHESLVQNNPNLVNLTFQLIKRSKSIKEILILWESRLVLHLFNNNLQIAKREAINLNNILYLSENNTPANNVSIYPLPKNNNAVINHSLIILLLRLKSVPNMVLLNEFYKLCYQLRLKSLENLSEKLLNLSFDIMVILIINKNYTTLINLLQSMITEMKLTKSNYTTFYYDAQLLLIIVKIFVYDTKGTPLQTIEKLISEEVSDSQFNDIKTNSIDNLLYVLHTIDPIYNQKSDKVTINNSEFTLSTLVEYCVQAKISGRILCCLLGIYNLSNTYGFKVIDNEGELLFTNYPESLDTSEDINAELCYKLITRNWCDNVHKLFGLE